MNKFKKNIKAIIISILSLLIVVSSFPVMSFAKDITDINSNAEFGVINTSNGFSYNSLNQVGHELHYARYDGNTYLTFCTQFGIKSPTGRNYDASEFKAYKNKNQAEYKEIAKYIFFGYTLWHGDGVPNNDTELRDACATQQFVWETLGIAPSRTSWKNGYMSEKIYNSWKTNTDKYINLYYNTRVSFHNQTHKVDIGKSITLTDTNGTLQYYPEFNQTISGINYKHNSNTNNIVITVTSQVTSHLNNFSSNNYNIKMSILPNGSQYDGNVNNFVSFEFDSGSVQNLMFSRYIDPAVFALNIDVQYGDIELTKQDFYSAGVNGAKFGLYTDKKCNNRVATATTANSKLKYDKLAPGTYYVKELSAPYGYLLDTQVHEVRVSDENTSKLTVKNDEPIGNIELTKKLDVSKTNNRYGDVNIAEAQYTLYAKEDIKNQAGTKTFYKKDDAISTKTLVDKNGVVGTIKWENLHLGKYYIKETKNPTGTFTDTQTYSVELKYKNETTSLIVDSSTVSTDVVKSQKVKVFKAGSDGSAGEMKGVSDAQFSIKLNADYTNAINQGYKLEEIWASADSNGNYKGIDINGNVVTVDKTRATEAQKIAPSYAVITSNKDGYAISNYLPFGRYIMKETNTPKDYIAGNDVVFNIEKDESEYEIENAVKNININNALFESPVKIIKKDVDSNNPVTLSSASYKIRATQDVINRATGKVIYHKGDYVQVKVGNNKYNVFKTNSDNLTSMQKGNVYASKNDEKGSVTTPFKLQAGYYEIVEVESPDGFLINTKPVPFVVTNTVNLDKDADGDVISIVTQSNKQPKANIQINKSFELREDDVDTSLISKDENGNISNLNKVTFELTAADTITDKTDGRVVYNKGDIVATKNLTNGRTIKFNNLWIGSYIVKEISTIDGAVLDTTEYPVTFETKDNTTEQYYQTFDITNYTTEIDVSKVDSTGANEIAGANLTITDENGNVVDTWVSTTEIHKIEGIKAGKTYTLTEDMSPLGYNIANSIEFTVQNNKEIQKVSMTDNTVKVNKVDNNGNLLQGATLQVVSAKTKNIIDKWVTGQHIFDVTEDILASIKENGSVENMYVDEDDATVLYKIVSNSNSNDYTLMLVKDGEVNYYCIDANGNETSHMVRGLQEGDEYRLVELQAPDKYVVANSIEFATENKDIELSLTDKQVQISKTDITTGEELEGAKLTITDKDGNVVDEWTSTKEPHFASGLIEGQSYTLTEVSAPYGFTVAESIEFTVSADKETQKIVMKDDYIYSSVRVVKCDKTTKKAIKSNAFEFSIFADKNCTKLIATSGANKDDGSALFEKLKYGTYYIKETKAPLGYSLSDQVVEIVINDEGVFADGKNLEEKDGIYSFEYFDELLPIVQTGDNNNIKTIGIISGVLAIAILALVCVIKRLKKAKEGNAEQK